MELLIPRRECGKDEGGRRNGDASEGSESECNSYRFLRELFPILHLSTLLHLHFIRGTSSLDRSWTQRIEENFVKRREVPRESCAVHWQDRQARMLQLRGPEVSRLRAWNVTQRFDIVVCYSCLVLLQKIWKNTQRCAHLTDPLVTSQVTMNSSGRRNKHFILHHRDYRNHPRACSTAGYEDFNCLLWLWCRPRIILKLTWVCSVNYTLFSIVTFPYSSTVLRRPRFMNQELLIDELNNKMVGNDIKARRCQIRTQYSADASAQYLQWH